VIGFERTKRTSRTRPLGWAGAGGAGLAVAAAPAGAGIIHSGSRDVVLVRNTDQDSFSLDLNEDSIVDFIFGLAGEKDDPTANIITVDKGDDSAPGTGWLAVGGGNPAKLSAGDVIDKGDSFSGDAPGVIFAADGGGQWDVKDSGFLGVSFFDNGGDDVALPRFGWVELAVKDSDSLVINQWAHQSTPNQGIQAGDTGVPAPGTGMLALAGVGAMVMSWLGARRRRRGAGARAAS